jgi:hypothetical protein
MDPVEILARNARMYGDEIALVERERVNLNMVMLGALEAE